MGVSDDPRVSDRYFQNEGGAVGKHGLCQAVLESVFGAQQEVDLLFVNPQGTFL